jgi:hypothetical protein
MTNNVGMTMRQARPQYLSNGGLGAVAGGIGAMFGGNGGLAASLGRKKTGGMTPAVNEMAGQIRTQPVGAPVPISGGTMTTMPVGRPMPMPQAPVNVRNALGTAVGNATSTPMNPRRPTMMNPMGSRGSSMMLRAGNRLIR